MILRADPNNPFSRHDGCKPMESFVGARRGRAPTDESGAALPRRAGTDDRE